MSKCLQLMEEKYGYFVSVLFMNGHGIRGLGTLTCNDWENIINFLKFFKLFYDITMWLLGSLYILYNIYFQKNRGIQAHLQAFSDSTGDYVLSATSIWGILIRLMMWSFVYQNISIIIITTRNRMNPCRIGLYWGYRTSRTT